MPDRAALEELIARVEKATGFDHELDEAISAIDPLSLSDNIRYATFEAGCRDWPDHYTGSLDAAIALCERVKPGVWWFVAKGKTKAAEPLFGASLWFGEQCLGEGEHATNAPLALLAAMLRALIKGDSNV